MAKVLLINGSPNENGCTARALQEMMNIFASEGVETELFQVGRKEIRGCIACGGCQKLGHCVFDDDIVNEVVAKLEKADALIVGSPVYYASPNGSLISLLDRLMFSKRVFKANEGRSSNCQCQTQRKFCGT